MSDRDFITDEEIAAYIAEQVQALQGVCDVKGWTDLCTALATAIAEAKRLAGETGPKQLKH